MGCCGGGEYSVDKVISRWIQASQYADHDLVPCGGDDLSVDSMSA